MIDVSGMSQRDRTLVERAQRTLLGNVIQDDTGGSPYGALRGIAPSLSNYPGVWNWDAAFHLRTVSLIDPPLARDQARILFSRQLENGQLADVLFANGQSVFRFTKPPVLAWAIAEADRRTPDDAFLKECYPHLARNLRWWEQERSDGNLFYYRVSRMESGWDNTPRFDFPNPIGWCYAVDLNGYMTLFYETMADVSHKLGKEADETDYLAKKHALEAQIERRLYSEKLGAYCDYNFVLRRFTGRLSPASFLPLYTGAATEEHAEKMARLAADARAFCPAMPTIAYGDRAYRSAAYWRGPAWLNTAYFAVEGLRRYGYRELAMEIVETILGFCADNPDAIYEYYDSRTGKGLGARDFGWSAAFLIELILLKYDAGGGKSA